MRKYSLFGVKTVEFNPELGKIELKKAKELEKKIIWSFAHLFENPFLSGKGIYFSESRSLSAHHGEWLTFDPMLKWSPENLLSNPTDMNGFRYVNGDPVNFVDPSGYATEAIGVSLTVNIFNHTITAGIHKTWDDKGNSAWMSTYGYGPGGGSPLGGGITLEYSRTNAESLHDLAGWGNQAGGGYFGTFGGQFEVNIGNGYQGATGGVGIGGGLNAYTMLTHSSLHGIQQESMNSTNSLESFSNSSNYNFGVNQSSGSSDYWSSNPYE